MQQRLTNRDEEPIMALASGRDTAAIALVRISGKYCHELLRSCLSLTEWPEKIIQHVKLVDPQTHKVLDDPMAVFFYGPRSFTGQDSVELYLHGGSYIVKSVLEVLGRLGIRYADPGEFTKRAFLGGKIDLTEAEGINALIHASSKQEWIAARYLVEGKLKHQIEDLRLTLIEAKALLEALIDFPDERDINVGRESVLEKIEDVFFKVSELVHNYESGKVAAQGLRVAIIGEPNVGKSTLMNLFLDKERAIVTDIPGTTRDYLEEECLVKGRLIRIVDTAGLRETKDLVEEMGVKRSLELSAKADIILFLLPSDSSVQEHDRFDSLVKKLGQGDFLKVRTKTDLCKNPIWDLDNKWIGISSLNNEGLDQLKEILIQRIDAHVKKIESSPFITSERHFLALQEALEGLSKFKHAYDRQDFEEILSFELLLVLKSLDAIVGAITHDDVLDAVFSKFCVGK